MGSIFNNHKAGLSHMATMDSRNDADVLFLPEDDAVATNSGGKNT